MRDELLNEAVYRVTSLDEQDDLPGLLELGAELWDRFGPDYIGTYTID